MRLCVVGAGAVGGFFGAKLARGGHEVIFIARGAHLESIRRRGLIIRDFKGEEWRARCRAEENPEGLGEMDFVFYAPKTYSNPEALQILNVVAADHAVVLTLQNGVDSSPEIEAVIGRGRVIGGAAYVATQLAEPGVIVQSGPHRRIAFGETTGDVSMVSLRCLLLETVFKECDVVPEPHKNGWTPLWEKYIYLAPFAGFTGASRSPIGALWSDPDTKKLMTAAFKEMYEVAKAERVPLRPGTLKRILTYLDGLDPSVKSSLLMDIEAGKPTEVEALLGGVVRRARKRRIKTPIMDTLYAGLKPRPAIPAYRPPLTPMQKLMETIKAERAARNEPPLPTI